MRADVHFVLLFVVLATLGSCNAVSPSTTNSPGSTATLTEAPSSFAGSDWPNFLGPKFNGFAAETGINKNWSSKPPKVLWQHPMTDQGYSGPASALGMVFIIDHQGDNDIVHAWRLSDGQEVWNYTYPDAAALDQGFTRSTPTVSKGMVYTVSRLGKVHCLDAKTGKVVWQKDMVTDFGGKHPRWKYAGSPVIDGDRVIVTPGADDAAIVALNAKTGALMLKGGSGRAGYATPVIAKIGGVKQYVLALGAKICGVEAATGKELWSVPWVTNYDVNAATPLVIGDSVFVTSGYGHGCVMVDVKDGQASIRWQNRAMQAHFSSPIYFDGKIYGTGDPGYLMCLNPADGSTIWRQPGFEKGGIVGVDGTMIGMNGSNGDVIMVKLDPTSYQELGRIAPIRGQAWTAPIIVDKKAVIRTKDAIAVIDLG